MGLWGGWMAATCGQVSAASVPTLPAAMHTLSPTHTRAHAPTLPPPTCSTGLLPGVFVNYELSPLRVRISERRRSLGHFLTNCCAIVGGVLTVAGMVDSLLYKMGQGGGDKSSGSLL